MFQYHGLFFSIQIGNVQPWEKVKNGHIYILNIPLFDGELLQFSDVQYYNGRGVNHWYHVVLMEGRHREVRRLFESQGLRVSRLKRVRFGPVVLPSRLRRGRWLELSKDDVLSLYRMLHLPAPRVWEAPRRRPNEKPTSVTRPSRLIPSSQSRTPRSRTFGQERPCRLCRR